MFREQDYGEYHLSSLFELDNFWTDLLIYLADTVDSKQRKMPAYFYNNLGWWFLINYGSEVSLFQHYRKKRITCYFVYPAKNFVNTIAVRNYQSIGHKAVIVNQRPLPESMDMNVMGENIIQVFYPHKILEKLRTVAANYNSAKDVSIEELNELVSTKCDIRMVVLNNAEIARGYREQLGKYFEKRII